MEKFGTGAVKDYKFVENKVNIWVDRWEKNDPFSTFTITKRDNDSFVGMVTLEASTEREGAAELFYLIDDQYWGQGMAKEAVVSVTKDYATALRNNWYEVNGKPFTHIVATARPDNKASVSILNSVGMKCEAQVYKFGHPRNQYIARL
jgi:RimJ/RimL family protein N-acetyltransferase